jgi:hypothetical protein
MHLIKLGALIGLFALATAVVAGPARSEEKKGPGDGKPVAPAAAVVYKPPLRGAPGGRVGGGTRGTGREAAFVLSVMAPDHTGLTSTEQPPLYWFISAPTSHPVEVTIVDSQETQPLLELRLDPPVAAGVHRVSLADRGVRLRAGVIYQWYVAVVPDSAHRSKDILAGGAIERVEPPADVSARLPRAAKTELPQLFAGAGLWYDAVAALGDLLEAAPRDRMLLEERAALLRQAGLPEMRTGN